MVLNISPFKFGQVVNTPFFTNRINEIELVGNNILIMYSN